LKKITLKLLLRTTETAEPSAVFLFKIS